MRMAEQAAETRAASWQLTPPRNEIDTVCDVNFACGGFAAKDAKEGSGGSRQSTRTELTAYYPTVYRSGSVPRPVRRGRAWNH